MAAEKVVAVEQVQLRPGVDQQVEGGAGGGVQVRPRPLAQVGQVVAQEQPLVGAERRAMIDAEAGDAALVQAGLLRREQRGVWAYYHLDRDGLERAATILDLKGVTV